MKTGVLFAWMVGEGIIIYRCVKGQHRPPMPGELLASSGLFVLLAMLAEVQPGIATTLAWGLDIAAALNLVQTPQLFGPASKPASTN